jgi:hypothetical protein
MRFTRRAKTEEGVRNLTITEAYRRYGITRERGVVDYVTRAKRVAKTLEAAQDVVHALLVILVAQRCSTER